MASGSPSSRRQMAATSAALPAVRAKPGRTMAACCTNSRAAPQAATSADARLAGQPQRRHRHAPAHPAGAAAAATSPAPPGPARPPAARPPPPAAVQLLQVVQHQQRPPITQVLGHRAGGGPVTGDIQAVGDGLPHHLGIADGRQRDEVDAVFGKAWSSDRGGGQRQPRLADTAGTGQRHQPQPRPGDVQRGPAQDHRPGRPAASVAPAGWSERPGSSTAGTDPVARRPPAGGSAPAPRCPSAGASPDPAPTPRPAAVVPPGAVSPPTAPPARRARPPRSAPPGARPARCTHSRAGRLTRMQAHPDPDRDTTGPVMTRQRPLRRHAAPRRIGGGLEDHEETVALGSHLLAVESTDRRTQHSALRRQRLAIPVAKTAQQRRRPLDVTEKHRDRPRGELLHHPSIITTLQDTRRKPRTQGGPFQLAVRRPAVHNLRQPTRTGTAISNIVRQLPARWLRPPQVSGWATSVVPGKPRQAGGLGWGGTSGSTVSQLGGSFTTFAVGG